MNSKYSLCPECYGLIPKEERVCHICKCERWPKAFPHPRILAVMTFLVAGSIFLLILWIIKLLLPLQ